ncbi:MAG: SirB2 family protein [Kangiellaceae bacterium]|nr:SirB2 family protein [Kangiellaceae bacterium]
MEYYPIIIDVHITTAVLSLFGFIIRGWWMASGNVLLEHKLVKIFPHVNDTVLLVSAIYLSITSQLYPFVVSWLGVKVVLLVGYIVAGIFALKKGRTKKTRISAFVIALVCIGAIFFHAITRPIYW